MSSGVNQPLQQVWPVPTGTWWHLYWTIRLSEGYGAVSGRSH